MTIDLYTCKNGCDLKYTVDGKDYSRKIWHKLLPSNLSKGYSNHWDCPDCAAHCDVEWVGG